MNQSYLKPLINDPKTELISCSISLYQRNLSSEAQGWLKKVEARAKHLKTGQIVLIAILKKD